LNGSRSQRCLRNAIGFAGLLAAAIAIRLNPELFDRVVARAANRLAVSPSAVSQLANVITFPAVQGLAVVSLACGCWFRGKSPGTRERLVRGCVAAVLAAAAAHFVRGLLPSVPKPIFDSGAQVRLPEILGDIEWLRANSNPNAQSFPSERATLFAGVAIAVFAANRRIGLMALAVTAVTELCRMFLGLHYPSDIFGSFFLAAMIYWLVDITLLYGLDHRAMEWERSSPATFYGVAFAGCYGLATAFEDLRNFLVLLPH
jgi:membrane-associated phospholipid phosphatase